MDLLIKSLKSKQEIINILKENTHEDISLHKVISDDNVFKKFFRGYISDDSFKIQKCTRGHLGFVPLAYGAITENKECTEINITIKRYKGINIFFAFWFSGLALLLILIAITNIKYFFIPLGMIIYGILINCIPYKIESKKTIMKLQEILK